MTHVLTEAFTVNSFKLFKKDQLWQVSLCTIHWLHLNEREMERERGLLGVRGGGTLIVLSFVLLTLVPDEMKFWTRLNEPVVQYCHLLHKVAYCTVIKVPNGSCSITFPYRVSRFLFCFHISGLTLCASQIYLTLKLERSCLCDCWWKLKYVTEWQTRIKCARVHDIIISALILIVSPVPIISTSYI